MTHHDYDADGTVRDEMQDAENFQREEDAVYIRFLHGLLGMTQEERHRLLSIEHTHVLPRLFKLAMLEGLQDVAATIEVHANSRDQH